MSGPKWRVREVYVQFSRENPDRWVYVWSESAQSAIRQALDAVDESWEIYRISVQVRENAVIAK